MVFLNVGLAVSAAMAAISALCSFSAAANAALKCAGSIFLNGGSPNAAPQRASSGLPGLARAALPTRALARRAAELPLDVLFDLALRGFALHVDGSLQARVARRSCQRAVMQR